MNFLQLFMCLFVPLIETIIKLLKQTAFYER